MTNTTRTVTVTGYNEDFADTATVVAALWAKGFTPVTAAPAAGPTRGHAEFTFTGYNGTVVLNTFDQRIIGLRYQGIEGFDWAIGDTGDLDLYQRAAALGRSGMTDAENRKFAIGI